MGDLLYFDHAATSLPKPRGVAEAMVAALDTFGGAGRGSHPAALAASRCIMQARIALSTMLRVSPERISLTANATESLNIAISGLLQPGDHVITTVLEHNSVLRPLYRLRCEGIGLTILDADAQGHLQYDSLSASIRPNTRAIVITHASNLTGMLVDMERIARLCKQHHLLLIVDAAQTMGAFPVHPIAQGIDVLCFTGHKALLGPQGTGGLYVREGLLPTSFKVGGSGFHSRETAHPMQMPEALEAGTANAHGIAGLLAGVRHIEAIGMERMTQHALSLADRLREGAAAIQGMHIYGDASVPHAPIVTLNIGDMDANAVGDQLATRYGICVRAGLHCAPLMHKALGTEKQGAVRFSFAYTNTASEVDTAIGALRALAADAYNVK